jgi:hypothetical protein
VVFLEWWSADRLVAAGAVGQLIMVWRDTVHDVSETLKTIEGYLGRWSASGGGLLVQSPEDRRRRTEDLLAAQGPPAWPAITAGQGTSNGRPRLKGRVLEVIGRLVASRQTGPSRPRMMSSDSGGSVR